MVFIKTNFNALNGRFVLLLSICFIMNSAAFATQYFTLPEAQEKLFAGAEMMPLRKLSPAKYERALAERSGPVNTTWLATMNGKTLGWVVAEHVIGKHDYIDFAIGINADGRISGFEILNYRESYGGQVTGSAWRQQFIGKRGSDAVKVGTDVQNISGATMSSTHLAESIKSLLRYHREVLQLALPTP